jgi:hypothetical protein
MKPRYERRGGGDFEFLYGVAFPTAGRNAREKRGEAGTTRRLIGMQGSLQLGTLPTAAEDTEKKPTSPLLAGLLGTTSAWISIGSQESMVMVKILGPVCLLSPYFTVCCSTVLFKRRVR